MGFNQAPALPYSKLGIPEDGDEASRAISKGKYVIWKGKNYFAKTDILQGETFVEDTNLTEIPDGALNGIADALNASFFLQETFVPNTDKDITLQIGRTIDPTQYCAIVNFVVPSPASTRQKFGIRSITINSTNIVVKIATWENVNETWYCNVLLVKRANAS